MVTGEKNLSPWGTGEMNLSFLHFLGTVNSNNKYIL